MKQEINELELEGVQGGTVMISDRNVIGFDTTKEKFNLIKNNWREVRNFVEDELLVHQEMTNAEFDRYIKNQLKEKEWI